MTSYAVTEDAARARLLYRGCPQTMIAAVERDVAAAGTPPLRVPTWGLADVVITFFAWLMLSLVVVTALQSIDASTEMMAALTVAAVPVPWLAMAGWPILVARLNGNGASIDFGLRWARTDLAWGVVYGAVALGLAAGIGYLTTLVTGSDIESSAGARGAALASVPAAALVFALFVALGAPIVEELCFRGLTLCSLAKRGYSPAVTVIASAVIFSLFHLEPMRIAMLFGIGVILAIARLHTGSLTTSIAAHMVINIPGAVTIAFLAA